jgi:3-hydroxyacyl-CoA dehydrogenase
MKRTIKKVAVLGAGLMGSGIACHFANAGIRVLLLDITRPNADEWKKQKPAPLFDVRYISRIETGTFDLDLEAIASCDWVIEVIVERLDIKRGLFEKIEKYRKPGTLITSNTSGIPIHLMAEGRSDDFRKHFCGTHFFNPPRYLRLLEIIPTAETSSEVVEFLMHFGDVYLGKQTVLCKDTPAFIGNRIGVYAMGKVYQLTRELGLSIEDADQLTGPVLGRPKTGTFRLGDLVGHDTAVNVIKGIKENCPNDEQAGSFDVPDYLQWMVDNKFLGNKSGQGFYKKSTEKDETGRTIVYALNLETLVYEKSKKSNLESLKLAKQQDQLKRRITTLFDHEDKGGQLIKRALCGLFAYASNRIPEISDTLYSIDHALKAGFAWEIGPFEYWDIIGIEKGIREAEAQGELIPAWVKEMVGSGKTSFYIRESGTRKYYDPESKTYQPLGGLGGVIILDDYRDQSPVLKNNEVTVHDIGDGVLCAEFTSPYNSIGEGILRGLTETIALAEDQGWKGLVIGNNGANFSVGANLMMIAMLAYQQEFDELNFAVNAFQQATMRCRYSSIPVVAATQGYVFGGGCELIMHCDAAMCSAESYIGLVEAGIGVIPGGGGTKEFALRASDQFFEGDVMIPTLIEKFKSIALASVATSAEEAFGYGYLLNGRDFVVMNRDRAIAEAKNKVVHLSANYVRPIERNDITVLGRGGLAALYVAANELKLGNYASEHDIKIAQKIAYVLCGGDLTGVQKVSEQYLLDVEREAFLSLCGEQKTLERIQHMLQTNKPLRN